MSTMIAPGKSMSELHRTAIHEAGHGVIGRAVTMACGGATIVADDESAGYSITADPYAVLAAWETREKWRPPSSVWVGRILAYMAGAEAEEVILGDCQGGDGDDRRWITGMLYEIAPEDEHEARETRLRRAARQLVRRHRSDIEAIARMLMERGTLTGEEIDAALPPGFMARPVTLETALATDVEDCGSLAEAVGRLSGPGAQ
ncbi:hypothetical protein FF100_04030 [Methylobacterium terricola]|uniref:Peptidase family M41 n=1 Tax=Methylobacterium terricola TaxID=2583531 RepID=A0A5C4LNJ3_9HYPH|nr:hypothetical protein [Methylobacterium terricola]TNC16422.1 hypothetical protein FF100_04030 [Methylobacterium terricola]